MRPIKFRAWDRKEKEMIEPAFTIENIGLGDGSLIVDERAQRGNELDWMQLTGLLDKNGKEIYENDILRVPYGKRIEFSKKDKEEVFLVTWHEDRWWPVDYIHYDWDLRDSVPWDESEVIGNVYQHPELLKEV
jgi:uncharacterized phage protein (TIGR01671 family)